MWQNRLQFTLELTLDLFMATRRAAIKGSRPHVAAEQIDHSDGEKLTEVAAGVGREPPETENWPGVKF